MRSRQSSGRVPRRDERLAAAPTLRPGWALRQRGGLVVLEARALARLGWVTHGFSTRAGGLNLGLVEWDRRERVERNRRRFYRAVGASGMEAIGLRQFHSAMVRIVPREGQAGGDGYRGDALATQAQRVLLTVETADCVPILLADTRNRAIAAIHAGWRGTAARIAQKTIGNLRMHFGTRPEDLVAAIGPAAGVCCYEVGTDVAQEFASRFPQAADWFDGPFAAISSGDEPAAFAWLETDPPGHARPRRAKLDLAGANRWQLENAGVPAERIHSCGLCTICQAEWLFSHRREGGRAGRQMSAIGMP